MEKFSIKNRYGLRISGEIHKSENSVGLAFVLHGLGGSMKQIFIKTMGQTFFENGYTVVSFDNTNSNGSSEGNYENATVKSYYDDFIDIINWAKSQDWYLEPFVVSGASLGGYSALRYAEENSNEVKAIFSIAGLISGKLNYDANLKIKPEKIQKWKATGWLEEKSISNPGLIKRLPWSHMEERLTHDLIPKISSITMPVLLVVGSNDLTHIEDQNILMNILPESTPKELHVVEGAPHDFLEESHLNELKNILNKWVKKLK